MVTPRSAATFKRLDCRLGQREQLNMLTHWLDMSQTYGTYSIIAHILCEFYFTSHIWLYLSHILLRHSLI